MQIPANLEIKKINFLKKDISIYKKSYRNLVNWLSSGWLTTLLWEWDKPIQKSTAKFTRLQWVCKLQSVCWPLNSLPQYRWWTVASGGHGHQSSIKAPPCHSWAGSRLNRGTRQPAVVGVPIQELSWGGLLSHCWGAKMAIYSRTMQKLTYKLKKI